MKSLLTTSTLKSFYLLETRFENISTDHSKSISVSCYSDSINTRVRKSINLSTESSVSTISSISESFLILERLQELYLLIRQISLTSSASMMKLITFRIQISNSFYFSYSILRQELSTEVIRSLREHYEIISVSVTKNLVSFVSMLNSILSHQKQQESSSISVFESSFFFEKSSKTHLIV